MNQAWILGGKAAAILGYRRDPFREKFEGIISSRKLPGRALSVAGVSGEEAGRSGCGGGAVGVRWGVWVE